MEQSISIVVHRNLAALALLLLAVAFISGGGWKRTLLSISP